MSPNGISSDEEAGLHCTSTSIAPPPPPPTHMHAPLLPLIPTTQANLTIHSYPLIRPCPRKAFLASLFCSSHLIGNASSPPCWSPEPPCPSAPPPFLPKCPNFHRQGHPIPATEQMPEETEKRTRKRRRRAKRRRKRRSRAGMRRRRGRRG